MRFVANLFRMRRAPSEPPSVPPAHRSSDDAFGRGMDLALTVLAFLIVGALIDRWLGTAPVFTIVMILLAGVGTFIHMKYVYDGAMEQLEAERRAARRAGSGSEMEGAA